MTKITSIIGVLGMGVLALLGTSSLFAGTGYVEDFRSFQYRDAANTTAFWDTNGRRLGLHPFEPLLVGGKDTPGYSRDLVVHGDYVYLVDGEYGLQIFDITDPANPDSIANYNTSGFSSDVFVSGKHAFIADGLSGLQVIDISDPSQPVRIGGYDTPGYARGVSVEGDYAYVAEGDPLGQANLRVFDISDPTSPRLTATLPVAGLAIGTFVHGDYLYLAGGPGGMHIISISNPRTPSLVATFPTPTYTRNVVVASGRAYLATAESGLMIIDVNDPANPFRISTYNTPDYAFGVAVVGNRVYVADDETGLIQFEVFASGTPILKSTVDTPGKAISVAVSGCYAYVADGPSSLRVIRVSEPFGPLPLATNHDVSYVLKAANEGHHTYVLSRVAFTAFDMSMPEAPLPLSGRALTVSGPGDIAIAGHHAFVAAGTQTGLAVFDITEGNPSVPAIFPTGSGADGVAISGDYAFVLGGYSIIVVRIEDPMAPTLVTRLTLSEPSGDIALVGDYLLLPTSRGVIVVDITTPSAPVELGRTGPSGYRIAVQGSHAFVLDYDGLNVLDISNPASPAFVGSVDTPGDGLSVAVDGNLALVGYIVPPSDRATAVIDITDPTNPTIVTHYTADDPLGLCITGDYACAVGARGGLTTIEIRQRLFDLTRNVAQSTDLYDGVDDIVRVKLTTVQNDTVGWELTADGATWMDIEPSVSWVVVSAPGNDLRWRSTHKYTGGLEAFGPFCERLELEWRYHHPMIDSIVDVPDDDGGWVDLHFTASGHDFFGDATAITQYILYRRSDAALTTREFGAALDSLPPGNWEPVGLLPASGADRYTATIPTHTDSAAAFDYSAYVVAASSLPMAVYYSPPDSGYSVNNGVAIVSFNAQPDIDSVMLHWDVGGDVSGFNIYRSTKRAGLIQINTQLLPAAQREYADDTIVSGAAYWYQLGVVDHHGSETLSGLLSVNVPRHTFVLLQNRPNPFRPYTTPFTTIDYETPADGHVLLQIFDVAGRLVRTLVDKPQIAGPWRVSWNGTNDREQPVASGVYFYRLQSAGLEQTHRMTLLK